jgi:phosphoribosylglycinamide formyltransferase-1
MTGRVVVLASGAGSNLQALIDASLSGVLGADIVAVVSNVPGCGALARASAHGIPGEAVELVAGEKRTQYDTRLSRVVGPHRPDLVVLAGWMRILTDAFLDSVGAPVVNLHPALPGQFPGVDSIGRAWAERHDGRTESGVMVHLVPDEGVDDGPVIAVCTVPLQPTDSLAEFTARMHAAEHRLIVGAVAEALRVPDQRTKEQLHR